MPINHSDTHTEVIRILSSCFLILDDLAAARQWYLDFTHQVFVPMLSAPRADLLVLFGRLRRANAAWRSHINRPHVTHHCECNGCLYASATLSALTLLTWTAINRHKRQVREIVPMMPIAWHAALYFNFDITAASTTFAQRIFEVIWDPVTDDFDEGLQYIGVHLAGDPGDWYPGAVHRFVQRGITRGTPRWTRRLAEHGQAISCERHRDASLWRYCHFRDLGLEDYVSSPVFFDTVYNSFNRETVLIKARRPRTTGRDEDPLRHRNRQNPRRRPPQSTRRRAHQRSGKLAPPLETNFNASPYTHKHHLPFGLIRPAEKNSQLHHGVS